MKHLIRSSFGTLVLSMVSLLAISSCITSDPYIGNAMVPPSQQMYTAVDSSLEVKTYNITVDSIVGNNVTANLIVGQHLSDISGEFKSTGFTNFMPMGFMDDTYFGEGATIDSMSVLLDIAYQTGDTSMGLATLNMYEVVDYNFSHDTKYYTNFDITPYINPTPLFTAEVSSGGGQVTGHLPMSYAERFLDNTVHDANIYNYDTLMHEKFNGLYFELIPPQGSKGAIYSLSLDAGASRMYLYYSNDAYPDSSIIQYMYFSSPNDEYEGFNTSLNMYSRDYTKADVSKGGIDYRTLNDTINAQPTAYVCSPVGVSTRVELVSSMIDSLVSNAKDMGYETIALHKAELKWKKVDQSDDAMLTDLTDLGMYYDYGTPIFMPDYQYILNYYDPDSYPITLGGALNRMSGYYVQDITRYLQAYLSGLTQYDILEMSPLIDYRYIYGNTEVYGSEAENPADRPQLTITYTLTK